MAPGEHGKPAGRSCADGLFDTVASACWTLNENAGGTTRTGIRPARRFHVGPLPVFRDLTWKIATTRDGDPDTSFMI